MNQISSFIRKEIFLLTILFLSLINPYFYGYRIIAFMGIYLILNLKKSLKSVDIYMILLGVFSAVFEFFGYLNSQDVDQPNILNYVFNSFAPILIYLAAKVVSSKGFSTPVYSFLLFFISLSFSLIPIISIVKQILDNSFLVGSRNMNLIWDEDFVVSATGLGSYFTFSMASFALIFSCRKSKTEKYISFGVFIHFLISLACVLRLGSRTQLFTSFICVGIIILKNFKYYKQMNRIIIVVGLIFFIALISHFISNNEEILFFFSDRMGSDDSGLASAGGRLDRWTGSIGSLFTDPFGWPLARFGYAHNLWLDVARVGGLIPFIFLVIFSILLTLFFLKSIYFKAPSFLRDYFIVFWVSISVVFMVEPILDGMYLFFLIHCFAAGLIVKQKSI